MALFDAAPAPCPHMEVLIELLGGCPSDRDKRAVENVNVRLDLLEYEARGQGARDETLAAIRGAKILLSMAELPPPRRPSGQALRDERSSVDPRAT